mgnify:CR=1 FL=1
MKQLPTVDQVLKLQRQLKKAQEDREESRKEAIKNMRDEFLAEKELETIRLRAAGKEEEAQALEDKIELMKEDSNNTNEEMEWKDKLSSNPNVDVTFVIDEAVNDAWENFKDEVKFLCSLLDCLITWKGIEKGKASP